MLLLLLLFFGLRVTCFGLIPAQQQEVLDEVSVIHITTISVKQHIAPPSRFVEEEVRLAERLTRPKTELKSAHPRYRLLSALYAFDSYCNVTATEINRFKRLYDNVPAKQKSIVKKALNYDAAFTEALDLVEHNGQVADAVVNSGLAYYNISLTELDQFVHVVESLGKQPDRISVSQALKSFVRDWALEGELERELAFACVLDAVNSAFSHRQDEVGILVLGSGLNRLGYDIGDLSPSFTVTTNEYSAFVNLAYRFLLGSPEPYQHTIHPYIETWSHARTRSEINRAISFPNRHLDPHKVLHVEGDFTRIFSGSPYAGKYDAVVTLFFIDTARNLISYFETIHNVLKKGGLWINFGPLLYGSAPWVQLTLDEIVQVIESMGFEFVSQDHRCGSVTLDSLRGKVWGQDVLYNFNSSALLRSGYQGQFWVVRKL